MYQRIGSWSWLSLLILIASGVIGVAVSLAVALESRAQQLVYKGRAWSTEARHVADKTTVWTNAGADGDWDNAGNWNNGIPANGADDYDVVFDPAQTLIPPNVNLNQAGDTVNSITFMRGWKNGIGSAGSPLEIKIDSASAPVGRDLFRGLTILGDGDYHFEAGAGGSVNILVDTLLGRGTVYLDGPLRNVIVRNGNVEVIATATIGTWYFQFGQSTVKMIDGATLDDLLIVVNGGKLEIESDLLNGSEVHVNGAEVFVRKTVRTRFFVWNGGYLGMEQKDTLHISTYFCLGGEIDFAGSAYTPDLGAWLIGPMGHINWHADFWQDPGAVGLLTVDLREEKP